MNEERIFLSPPWLGGSERHLVEQAFDSGYIAPCGPFNDRFEREIAAFSGVPHACAVVSGTAALDLLYHDLDIMRGDRVFCSDLTFIASIGPAVQRGAEPVFIDCDRATWTMDPTLLAEALGDAARRGQLPKAVVATDLYGQCCDYARLEHLCATYEVPLIVDASEALGAVYTGDRAPKAPRAAGDAGWAGVYSFNGNKIMTTSGGGMLVSRNAEVVARARKRAQQAREDVCWYEHREIGYNYRMSNLLAALGIAQLSHLPEILQRKRQIFAWYQAELATCAGISFMPEAAYGQCTRWLTVMLYECADKPCEALEIIAAGAPAIEMRPVWKPMHMQPVFETCQVYGGSVGRHFFEHGVCLPSGAGLTRAQVARVAKCVRVAIGLDA